ncbi:MAG TPA: glycosyltransferase [Phycisphaerae bacterium]|jgi:spore maturation protein CgeB
MPLTVHFFRMGMSNKEVALRFMGIYEAQFRGIELAGARVKFSLEMPETGADVVVCTADAGDIGRVAEVMGGTGGKGAMVIYVPPVDQWFDAGLLRSVANRVAFVYGPVVSEVTEAAYAGVGIRYRYLPFGADPELMRPLGLVPEYDVVFLGGLRHRRGYQPFVEPLVKGLDPKRVLLMGSGWEKYGIASQPVAYGARVNELYNLGRVCINFHAPEQCRGKAVQLDLNNRVFDLAMAGCVQVCDNPEGVAMHFEAGEIFAEGTAESWVGRVMACLRMRDEELKPMRQAARARALAEHTWMHRGRMFLSWING